MRVLVVAFLCALAITARSQCSKDIDCSNGGTCSANKCTCSKFVDNGITREYSGPTCKDFSSWWYTENPSSIKQTAGSCQSKYAQSGVTQTCNGKGDLVAEICMCKSYYDGNTTTKYHGECCQNWFSAWHTSTNEAKTSGKDSAYTSCAANSAIAGCYNHGTCTANGTCVCSKTVSGNRTTEYFGSNCNSYHSWWWWWNSSSKSYQQQELWGVGQAWAGDGIGMSESRQEYYCWCANTSATAGSTGVYPCSAWCEKAYTCNNHGTCKTDKSETCTCDPNFTGKWCDQCKAGWGNTNSSDPTKLCNICAPGWYGPACNTQCLDDVWGPGCGGHGVCNAQGQCTCNPGYSGKYCTECAINAGYMTNSGCQVCSSDGTCNKNGVCHWNGTCACGTGFKGASCNQCSIGGTYPDCSGAQARSGAAAGAASDECEGPNLALPIILSILGTLLIMLIAFAIYKVVSNKSAGAGGAGTAKSSNWSEFEKDSSTAYSQL